MDIKKIFLVLLTMTSINLYSQEYGTSTIRYDTSQLIRTFFLQAELTINNNEKHCYNFLFRVEPLKTIKDLKTDPESPNAITRIYEVELKEVFLKLSSSLQPATDFTRRLMYRYDWIQPKVNLNGEVISVENKEELKTTWQELKSYIRSDYAGETVENYLEELDLEFETEDTVYPVLSQYYLFGLLFPVVPEKHGETWERKRIVELSPYDEEQFEEQAVYVETSEGKRMYNIKGTLLHDEETELEKFEGYAIIPVNQIFPTKVEVSTSIKNQSIRSQWHFNLEQY